MLYLFNCKRVDEKSSAGCRYSCPNRSGHYKIYCVNGNTGFNLESRIFYFIDLQNEEDYERKESSSAR